MFVSFFFFLLCKQNYVRNLTSIERHTFDSKCGHVRLVSTPALIFSKSKRVDERKVSVKVPLICITTGCDNPRIKITEGGPGQVCSVPSTHSVYKLCVVVCKILVFKELPVAIHLNVYACFPSIHSAS